MNCNIDSLYDFRYGLIDEVINIRALIDGKQIVVCKDWEFASLLIFMREKGDFKSDFVTSENAYQFMQKPPKPDIVSCIAKIEYMEVPSEKELFWRQLYNNGEFNLWDIKGGPMKYFDSKPKGKLLFLRVYKLSFDLCAGCDYTFLNPKMDEMTNFVTLERVQEAYRTDKCLPVLDDTKYNEKSDRIKRIIEKYL